MTESGPENQDDPQTPTASDASFQLFVRLWALAGVFHFLSYADWRWSEWYGLLLGAATLWALATPTWRSFAFFVGVDWLWVGWTNPYHPNHILFSWFVNLTILVTLAVAWKRRVQSGTIESNWCRLFAPWIRVELGRADASK